jgi:hypothetical protein
MPISDLELADLKSRTANALRTNSSVANVEGHIETLKGMIGKAGLSKVKAAKTPTEYLYQLILQAELRGTEPVQLKQPEPPPVVVEPPPVQTLPEEHLATEEPLVVELKEGGKHKKEKKDKKS